VLSLGQDVRKGCRLGNCAGDLGGYFDSNEFPVGSFCLETLQMLTKTRPKFRDAVQVWGYEIHELRTLVPHGTVQAALNAFHGNGFAIVLQKRHV
jgi:hypothetical protein